LKNEIQKIDSEEYKEIIHEENSGRYDFYCMGDEYYSTKKQAISVLIEKMENL